MSSAHGTLQPLPGVEKPMRPTFRALRERFSGDRADSNPPLASELREINQGAREIPKMQARRQHYVPAFALTQFAQPCGDRKAFMAQLDTRMGKPGKTRPNDAWGHPDPTSARLRRVAIRRSKRLLSIIERHSADAVKRIVADPEDGPSPEDRQTLS